MIWLVFALVSCLKLLFVPAYRSTDFEVHRNWLAITHSLPFSRWYLEDTSEWTLDYPPLFAWFEYALSYLAKVFDPQMLEVYNLNYASPATVLFMRLSVIFTDVTLAYGTKELCTYLRQSGVRKSSRWNLQWGSPSSVLAILLLGNAGLLLVDHIHFQYNGFLFGILLISIARTLQKRYVSSALWFIVLLNLKHIFLYLSPAYFIFLLRNYCMTSPGPNDRGLFILGGRVFNLSRFIQLASVVSLVTLVSLGPFITLGQIGQVLSRLFPFKRGLCHAYWAPNFWALYTVADKAALVIGRRMGMKVNATAAEMTGGLVQDFEHVVLPTITPFITLVCTLVAILPALVKLWFSPENPLHFVRCLVLCAFGSFMFGWHVHEKAVLLMIIPLTILAVVWKKEARLYLILSTVGHYSLTPLLFTPLEIPLKALIVFAHSLYAFLQLHQMFDLLGRTKLRLPLLSILETIYVLGLFPLFIYQHLVHPFTSLEKELPFLPLMLTSVYCALGLTYCWLRYYWHFLSMGPHKRKVH